MSQIRFFTEEQEARIPLLQQKWQNIVFSTERIDRDRDKILFPTKVSRTLPPGINEVYYKCNPISLICYLAVADLAVGIACLKIFQVDFASSQLFHKFRNAQTKILFY